MKLTKRMKNAILQAAIGNFVFLILLILAGALFLLPRITEAFEKRSQLLEVYSEVNLLEKQGISYGDLKMSANKHNLTRDVYTANILRNVEAPFYNEHFRNTGSESYTEFLDKKSREIQDLKLRPEYIEQDQRLNRLLPVYSPDNLTSQETLTDFYFINYIENLIYSFDLSVDGDIGVGDIIQVTGGENQSQAVAQKNSLSEDIFKIPLEFEVEGSKGNITDFIHFFEHVGVVQVENDILQVHNDNFIDRVIEGSQKSPGYNIYENQLADIEVLEWQVYPDASSSFSREDNLRDTLKGSQSRFAARVQLQVNFYVAGVPGYAMQQFINDVLQKYTDLSTQISADATKYTNQGYLYSEGNQVQALNTLQNLDSFMISLKENIDRIRLGIDKNQNIRDLYDSATDIHKTLERIEERYDDQKVYLNL